MYVFFPFSMYSQHFYLCLFSVNEWFLAYYHSGIYLRHRCIQSQFICMNIQLVNEVVDSHPIKQHNANSTYDYTNSSLTYGYLNALPESSLKWKNKSQTWRCHFCVLFVKKSSQRGSPCCQINKRYFNKLEVYLYIQDFHHSKNTCLEYNSNIANTLFVQSYKRMMSFLYSVQNLTQLCFSTQHKDPMNRTHAHK